jgi:hypothetical protein
MSETTYQFETYQRKRSKKWRQQFALQNFDVLACVNEAIQWENPPPMDDRWLEAVCKAAALVKAEMLKAYKEAEKPTGSE